MPIQEEENAPGTPAAKAGPLFKPSSTSGWDPTLKGQGQWIGIDVQESKGPYCFEVLKIHHSITSSESTRFSRRWRSPLRPSLLLNTGKSHQTKKDIG